MINKQSPVPIYYQLEVSFKDMIEKGELKYKDMIPSERELAAQHNISRMTVRQALTNLVNDGFLIRKKGLGTFVDRPKIEQKLKGLTSFTEDMLASGMKPSAKLLDFSKIEASKSVADKLSIQQGDPVYEIKRLRLADAIPMALETTYLPFEIFKDLNEQVITGSLYEYIENELQLTIKKASQVLEASIAKKTESSILDISVGAPVLLIERYSYLDNHRPLEFVKSVYRADRYKFTIDMER